MTTLSLPRPIRSFGTPRPTLPAALPVAAIGMLGLALGGAMMLPALACIAAVIAGVRERMTAMLALLGIAAGISPATTSIFLPLLIALVAQGRVPARAAPAGVMGLALGALAYAAPTAALPLSAGAPNLWLLASAVPLPLMGLAVALTVGTGAALAARLSIAPLAGNRLIAPALLCALAMPLVMPGARAIEFAPAALIAIWQAAETRSADSARPLGAIVASLLLVLALPGGAGFAVAVALMLFATATAAQPVLRRAANDNPLLARTA